MKTSKQGSKGKELLEDPELLLDRSEEFFQRNRKPLMYVGVAILLAGLAFFYYRFQQKENNGIAQEEMIGAQKAWEKDSLKIALNGDAKKHVTGLLDISDEYSGTQAGKLASYQAGVALLKQGKFEEAIEKLKEFKSNDLLVQGISYSLIGDAYMELKDYANAEEYYAKASNYKPNENFTPYYLMKLGLACELQKNYENAEDAYERIITQFPKSRLATDAKKYKAKAEGLKVTAELSKK